MWLLRQGRPGWLLSIAQSSEVGRGPLESSRWKCACGRGDAELERCSGKPEASQALRVCALIGIMFNTSSRTDVEAAASGILRVMVNLARQQTGIRRSSLGRFSSRCLARMLVDSPEVACVVPLIP